LPYGMAPDLCKTGGVYMALNARPTVVSRRPGRSSARAAGAMRQRLAEGHEVARTYRSDGWPGWRAKPTSPRLSSPPARPANAESLPPSGAASGRRSVQGLDTRQRTHGAGARGPDHRTGRAAPAACTPVSMSDPGLRQSRGLHQMPEHACHWNLASGPDQRGRVALATTLDHRTNGDESRLGRGPAR
jgi:hypothetical protein